ncbi:MAG: hypothetical protein Kow002_02760 [Anaerolineales bacterium]
MSVQCVLPDAAAVATTGNPPMLEKLSMLRQEWEAAAGADSLLNVTASVGMLLLDMTNALGLTPEERSIVLGSRLNHEAFALIEG